MEQTEQDRFDAKLPKYQKNYFQRAADIGGYRSLTDFVFSSAQEKADQIIEKERILLKSEQDKKVFFSALMNPPSPNTKLQKAAQAYKNEFGA